MTECSTVVPIQLTERNGEIFADSRQIAERFQKEHKVVLRAIRDLISKSDRVRDYFIPFTVNDLTGENTSHYEMNRDGFTLLVMGFTGRKAMQFKLDYIDAFNQMEANIKNGFDIPQTLPDALRLAAEQTDKLIAAEAKLKEQEEAVSAHEVLIKAEGLLNPTEAAKALGIKPRSLFKWLSQNGWIYKRAGSKNWLGYADKCNRGFVDHKCTFYVKPDGSDGINERVFITPEGLARLALVVPKGRA